MLRLLRPTSVRVPRAAWPRFYSSGDVKDKDITYVNLSNLEETPESTAAASNFFEYQTGRWLTNDRAERAARRTPFDFRGLIDILYKHADVSGSGIDIETLEPLFEGKHNKVYRIVLKDQRSYVLRLPYSLGSATYRRFRLLSEAATQEWVSSVAFKDHPTFRAPLPLAYSGDANNELKTPYILSSFVAGEKLATQWKPWETEIDAKLPVLQPMADMAGAILSQKLPAYGSLYFASDLPSDVKTVKVDDRFVIGPSTEKLFWRGVEDAPEGGAVKLWGPWESWSDYLQATADAQLAIAEQKSGADSPNVRTARRYAQLVPSLFTEADLAGERASPRLYDPDLSPLNVIAQAGDSAEDLKLWLFDFENSVVKPYVLHGVPWFVRNPGERVYRLEDVPNFDSLPPQQQSIVRHFLSMTQTEFTYEKLLKERVPELIFAHHPNLKRREEVVHRASQTDIATGFHNDLDYSMFRLLELWDVVRDPAENPKVAAPLKFSEAETDELSQSIASWNQELMRNKFIDAKGFVPADEFDRLLGTGSLNVLDDKVGNYELTQEYLDSQDLSKNIK